MSYDFYAADEVLEEKRQIEEKIKKCEGKGQKKEHWMKKNLAQFIRDNLISSNWYSKLKEISFFYKNYEISNDMKKDDLRGAYNGFIRNINAFKIGNESLDKWSLFQDIKGPKIDIKILPLYSFFIQIPFTLKKPYISRDDEEFYIIDNPISKEKVFKVPYIRASSWKGNLRWAAMKNLIDEFDSINDEEKIKKRVALIRIFGNEKDEIESLLENMFKKCGLKDKYKEELRKYYGKKENEELNVRGRLQFYPTFFNKIGLDVINPHDRKTKTGKNPILFEVVPAETSGKFSLLYVPFDLIGNEKELEKQVREDLTIISNAIKKLLTVYGFSAKKTSGYGVAKPVVKSEADISFRINCSESEEKEFKKIFEKIIFDE